MTESTKDLIGWTQEDIYLALKMGWSKSGLQILRPSGEDWTIGMLMDHRITHGPDVLDPVLKGQRTDQFNISLFYHISVSKGFV